MKWKIAPNEKKKFLKVTTEGDFQKEDLNKMMGDIIKNAIIFNSNNILIDHRKATFSVSLIDTYERPNQFQESGVPRTAKIALLFSESENSLFNFFETVFVNRGFQVKLFTSIPEAENWLS